MSGIVKKVELVLDKDGRFDVDIKMNLSDQNLYHFERAVSEYCKRQADLNNSLSKEFKEEYGDISCIYDYLVILRDKIRQEVNTKYIPNKTWE